MRIPSLSKHLLRQKRRATSTRQRWRHCAAHLELPCAELLTVGARLRTEYPRMRVVEQISVDKHWQLFVNRPPVVPLCKKFSQHEKSPRRQTFVPSVAEDVVFGLVQLVATLLVNSQLTSACRFFLNRNCLGNSLPRAHSICQESQST